MSWKVVVVLDSGEKLTLETEYGQKEVAENMVDQMKQVFRENSSLSMWDKDGDYVAIHPQKIKAIMATNRRNV